MKKPIYIRLDDELLKYVDEFAEETGITRAGAISVIISQYRKSMNGINSLQRLMDAYEEEKAKGKTIELSE